MVLPPELGPGHPPSVARPTAVRAFVSLFTAGARGVVAEFGPGADARKGFYIRCAVVSHCLHNGSALLGHTLGTLSEEGALCRA